MRGYAKVVYGVDLTLEEAKRFRSMFFQSYPGIGAWRKAVKMKGGGEARTLSGRRRRWPCAAATTKLLNTPVQGTSADITKKALSLLPQRLAGVRAWITGTVHDEIILEVPEEKANDAVGILRETMIDGKDLSEQSSS